MTERCSAEPWPGSGWLSNRARRRRCGDPRLPHPGGQVPLLETTPRRSDRIHSPPVHSFRLHGTFVLELCHMTHDAVIRPVPQPPLARLHIEPHVSGVATPQLSTIRVFLRDHELRILRIDLGAQGRPRGLDALPVAGIEVSALSQARWGGRYDPLRLILGTGP